VLKANSATRVAKNPILSKIANATKVLKARRNDTRIPLQRTAWDQRKKDQRTALDAASPDLKNAPMRLTVKPIHDDAAPPPPPNGKPDDRVVKWRDNLAKDPWVDECVDILADIK
jgi:hypothetical protein